MKNKTDITILLDRSGSMNSIRKDMEGAFGSFVNEQKQLTDDECTMSMYQFDTQIQERYVDKPIQDVPALGLEPRGSTALYDALEHVISKTGERLAGLPEEDRPARVVFVVITDGEENASRNASAESVKGMIQHQMEKYSWHFVYLGANQDAFAEGGRAGFVRGSTMNYEASSEGVKCAYASISGSLSKFRKGQSKSVEFDDSESK